jgi:hypothetical protein
VNLTDGLFYLIVHGPGFGESVVVRVPPDTWIVLDGCHIGGHSPAAALLADHGGRWSCALLTHPHLDHACGLDAVLALPGAGPLGCSDPRLSEPGSWESWSDPEELLRRGTLEQVMAVIQDRWSSDPGSRWEMRRNDRREIGEASLLVLHPDPSALDAPPTDPNRLSAALLVTWRGVRCLLGGDVIGRDWDEVSHLFESADLARCAGLKMPHHGSTEAVHGCWGDGAGDRLWIAAPFNKGGKLPSFGDDGGMAWALERVDRVHLTGLPVAHDLQARVPCETTRQALRDGGDPSPEHQDLQAVRFHLAPSVPGDTEACFVAAGFDEHGSLVDLRHGPGAVVVRDATSTAR